VPEVVERSRADAQRLREVPLHLHDGDDESKQGILYGYRHADTRHRAFHVAMIVPCSADRLRPGERPATTERAAEPRPLRPTE
jgi:hypothetical protein